MAQEMVKWLTANVIERCGTKNMFLKKKASSEADYFVCDRFWPSTVAYEVATAAVRDGTALPSANSPLYRWPADLFKPSSVVIFLLNLDEKERISRLCQRRSDVTLEEDHLAANAKFRELVSLAYSRIENVVPMDAAKPLEELVNIITNLAL